MTDFYAAVDWAKLIDMMGGPTALQTLLPDVNYKTVYQWRRRNRVPGYFVVPLIDTAIATGTIKSVRDLPRIETKETT